jgi:hypothetical protein
LLRENGYPASDSDISQIEDEPVADGQEVDDVTLEGPWRAVHAVTEVAESAR